MYVIEARDERGGLLMYVGSTQHTPERRLEQHKKGKKYCSTCKCKHYAGTVGGSMKLRYDLFASYNPQLSREDAERIERWLAAQLRKRGYRVRGGH